tara:strand:+ start:58 stop:555 length:498 start_codon:yes stop_codon:yes gene_type:complete
MTGGKMSILEDKNKEIKNLRQTNLMKKILLITHTVGSIKQEKTKGVPYKITSWNTVHDVVKQKLLEQEVLIIPFIKEHTKEGNLTTVKCYADIIDTNTGEQIRVGDYVGYGIDQSDKGCGKATTYAYKYLLMKLFMLEVGEDEDSEFSNPPMINNKQLGKTEDDI